ncbi:MAG: HYR domain-containing protein, partial [Acidobacteriota bacterium]|nr:HYR domain-containing protein [Acidobacteriota bacterium]
MKRLAWLVFVVFSLAFVPMLSSQAPGFAGGDGTPANPYQIVNCSQLQAMNNNPAASYILMNDVDCSETVAWNAGAGFAPVGQASAFTGTFNGQNHKIINLFINRPSEYVVGLFAFNNGTISNVGLVNANVSGYAIVGTLAGQSSSSASGPGMIENCYATGIVTGNYYAIGGLVGWLYYSTIRNSCANVSLSGISVGGLVGNFYGGFGSGFITNSYASGNLNVPAWGGGGGLVGNNERGWGTIENSYSTGNVTQGGGLVGSRSDYYNTDFTFSSYWDLETSGRSASEGGIGKTTAEMKQQATFLGWDFVNIWKIKEGASYPYFSWQNAPLGIDNNPPVIAAHADVTAEAASSAGAVVDYVPPTATDDFDENVIVTCTPAPGSPFALGDTTVTCRAEDAAGNQATPTSFVVHVADTTPPLPDVSSLPAKSDQCSIQITTPPTATDICDGTIIGTTNDPLQYLEQGIYTIQWAFTDRAGNVSTQSQTVAVEDTLVPTIYVSAPECVTYGKGNGNKANKITVTAQDNCSPSVIPQITKVEVFNKGGNLVGGNG